MSAERRVFIALRDHPSEDQLVYDIPVDRRAGLAQRHERSLRVLIERDEVGVMLPQQARDVLG